MVLGTVLVVLTTNDADSAAIADWLGPQLSSDQVVRVTGFYAGISALEQQPRAAVINVGSGSVGVGPGRDDWRLAELRARAGDAAVVLVADAIHLAMLAGATRADLAVTAADKLPPLRELLLTDEPVVTDQTSWRRSNR